MSKRLKHVRGEAPASSGPPPNVCQPFFQSFSVFFWVPGGSLAGDFSAPLPWISGRIRPPGPPLDRRGPPRTSIGTKNQPRRRILRPFRGATKIPLDCLQVPSFNVFPKPQETCSERFGQFSNNLFGRKLHSLVNFHLQPLFLGPGSQSIAPAPRHACISRSAKNQTCFFGRRGLEPAASQGAGRGTTPCLRAC